MFNIPSLFCIHSDRWPKHWRAVPYVRRRPLTRCIWMSPNRPNSSWPNSQRLLHHPSLIPWKECTSCVWPPLGLRWEEKVQSYKQDINHFFCSWPDAETAQVHTVHALLICADSMDPWHAEKNLW